MVTEQKLGIINKKKDKRSHTTRFASRSKHNKCAKCIEKHVKEKHLCSKISSKYQICSISSDWRESESVSIIHYTKLWLSKICRQALTLASTSPDCKLKQKSWGKKWYIPAFNLIFDYCLSLSESALLFSQLGCPSGQTSPLAPPDWAWGLAAPSSAEWSATGPFSKWRTKIFPQLAPKRKVNQLFLYLRIVKYI